MAASLLQVSLAFTATATVLTITMPPSATIATPGVYTIYAVTAFGRPSAGASLPSRSLSLLHALDRIWVCTCLLRECFFHLMAWAKAMRPTGVDVGLGGARPLAPYFQPVQTPYLANGVYTISSVGLAGCAAGNILAGGQTCDAGNGVNIGLAGMASSFHASAFCQFGFCLHVIEE